MQLKINFSILFLILFSSTLSYAQEFAHHPPPTDPNFLSAEVYPQLKKNFPSPPSMGSSAQKADEDELLKFQRERTEKECQLAKDEVHVGLSAFLGPNDKKLTRENIQRIEPFLDKVKNDIDFFIQKLKVDFPRERPFNYVKNLKPCIPKEITKAYPSGHAAISEIYALVLSDLFPEKRDEFEKRAKIVRDNRVMAGVHHRSDVEAGKNFAIIFYKELKTSELFKKEFNNIKSKL